MCVRFGFVDCESKTSVLLVTVMLLCGDNVVMCWHQNNTYLLNKEIHGENLTLEKKNNISKPITSPLFTVMFVQLSTVLLQVVYLLQQEF